MTIAIRSIALGDTYAHFLLDEILPEVGKAYNLVDRTTSFSAWHR